MQFTALKDFFSDELKSQYCAGLSYTVGPRDAKLAELVPQWMQQGKVRAGGPDIPAVGQASGKGTVK